MALTMRNDFVLDALEILEEHRVVARRLVLRVLTRRRDDRSPDSFELLVQFVDFLARLHAKRKMVQRAGPSSVDAVVPETVARGCDRESQARMTVFDHFKVVCCDRGPCSLFEVESEERHQSIVERDRNREVSDRNLEMVDNRLHGVIQFACGGD